MQDIYNETQQAKLLSLLFAKIRKCFCFIDLLLFFYRTVYYFAFCCCCCHWWNVVVRM